VKAFERAIEALDVNLSKSSTRPPQHGGDTFTRAAL
jgi:hypothetical protein